RSCACRLCDLRGDPQGLPVRAPSHRRPWPARGPADGDDGRGSGLAARSTGPTLMTGRSGKGGGKGGTTRGHGGRELGVRLKTARGRTHSSQLWLERQLNDPFVRRAKRDGFRSRAIYKLMEIDDKARILRPGRRVLDLGAAPGGWSQLAADRVGAAQSKGRVVAIDLLPIDPIAGVDILQMDFFDASAPALLRQRLGGPADVGLSGMAAHTLRPPPTGPLPILAFP